MTNNPLNKICSVCKKHKILAEFSKDKSKKDGMQNKCKSCVDEYNKRFYAKNSVKIKNDTKVAKLLLVWRITKE